MEHVSYYTIYHPLSTRANRSASRVRSWVALHIG